MELWHCKKWPRAQDWIGHGPRKTITLLKSSLWLITFCSTCRSAPHSAHLRQPSSCGRWELIQRPTTGHYEERKKLWSTQFFIGCLHQTSPLEAYGPMWKRRQKDCKKPKVTGDSKETVPLDNNTDAYVKRRLATYIGSAYIQVWWGPSTKRGKWTWGSHPLIQKIPEADIPGTGKISFLQQGFMGLLTTLWGRPYAQEPKTDPTIFLWTFCFLCFVLVLYILLVFFVLVLIFILGRFLCEKCFSFCFYFERENI